jgi:hypothetical protein
MIKILLYGKVSANSCRIKKKIIKGTLLRVKGNLK